jgi:hypothetical protein
LLVTASLPRKQKFSESPNLAVLALLFLGDFKSLTLIDAGSPGITLAEDIQLCGFMRKWNFIFQMLPDFPAELALDEPLLSSSMDRDPSTEQIERNRRPHFLSAKRRSVMSPSLPGLG